MSAADRFSDWHLVLNAVGTVLAVYGAALAELADQEAAKITEAFGHAGGAHVKTVRRALGDRPKIGERITE